MKAVCSWNDMEQFGVYPLTGEACSLSWRILCDLDERGAKAFRKCFGLPACATLGEAWNRGTDEHPHVASVMLTGEALIPLAVFLMLESGVPEVHLVDRHVVGVESGDPPEALAEMKRCYKVEHTRRFTYGGHGDRNQHRMSGRVE